MAGAEVYWIQLDELIKKEGFLLSQVYKADETGVFWRSLPNIILRQVRMNK